MADATAPLPEEVRPLVRPNILTLVPYRCARDDYSDGILLDANENGFGSPILREHLPSFVQVGSDDSKEAESEVLERARRQAAKERSFDKA